MQNRSVLGYEEGWEGWAEEAGMCKSCRKPGGHSCPFHHLPHLQAQGAMQQQMADKLAAVLEHFIHEASRG